MGRGCDYCAEFETVRHVLVECSGYDVERGLMVAALGGGLWAGSWKCLGGSWGGRVGSGVTVFDEGWAKEGILI